MTSGAKCFLGQITDGPAKGTLVVACDYPLTTIDGRYRVNSIGRRIEYPGEKDGLAVAAVRCEYIEPLHWQVTDAEVRHLFHEALTQDELLLAHRHMLAEWHAATGERKDRLYAALKRIAPYFRGEQS